MANDNNVVFNLTISGLKPGEAQRVVDTSMGEVRRALGQVNDGIARDAKDAADKTSSAWKENIRTLHDGIELAEQAWEKFKSLGEELARTSRVYGSLKGSIDDLRAATKGEVSDMDLILAKNRAFQKDLALTENEWAAVGRRAKEYSEALGIPMREALEQLIDGLATGRLKTLQQAGVMVDATTATNEYAKSLGISVDALDEEGKKAAITEAALKKMVGMTEEASDGHKDMASVIEKTMASVQNKWDQFLLTLNQAPAAINAIEAAASALITTLSGMVKVTDDLANHGFFYVMDTMFTQRGLGAQDVADFIKADQDARRKGRMNNVLQALGIPISGLPAAQGPDVTFSDDEAGTIVGSRKKRGSRKAKDRTVDDLLSQVMGTHGQGGGFLESAPDSDYLDYKADQAGGNVDQLGEEVQKQIDDLVKKASDRLDAAGIKEGGIMYRLWFGDGTPEDNFEKIQGFTTEALDIIGMVSDAGEKMGKAVGDSLAAAVAGDNSANFAKTMKSIVQSIAAASLTKAIYNTAEGFAALASGNPAAAAGFFTAAAEYTAVGAVAGISARAIGAAAGGAGATGSVSQAPTSRRGSEFRSGAEGGGSTGQAAPPPINLYVFPGGEAEAGRRVNDALEAYYRKNGRPN